MSCLQTESTVSAPKNVVQIEPEEIVIPVPWGHISGKWWGPKDIQPILAVHGWQDNAGTFDNLIPILSPKIAILCIDLTGHGNSSHLPVGSYYYLLWDGLLLIRRIVKHYKWNKIKILGHSLGGAIGFLYAASYPDEVDSLICLDIACPVSKNHDESVKITGNLIDRYLKFEKLTLDSIPCYDYDEIIDIVLNGYKGSITRESAEILMRRGMQPALTPRKYYFSRDPKLKVSYMGMIPLDLTLAYAKAIKCNYLNIRAVPGYSFEFPDHYQIVLDIIKAKAKRFEYHEVEGTHHVHLNNPEKVAPIIENFLGQQ